MWELTSGSGFYFFVGVLFSLAASFGAWLRYRSLRRVTDALVSRTLRSLEDDLAQARAQRDDEKRRSGEYFAMIEGACGERDRAMKLYHEQSLEHGAAQDMMLNVINQLATRLEKLGHRAEIPKILRVVRNDFFDRHVDKQQEPQKEGVEKTPTAT